MTKICLKCRYPLLVIKASTGCMGWSNTTKRYIEETSEPILLYKCVKCGDLWNSEDLEKRDENCNAYP